MKNGNVDTQMILVPNIKDMLYHWEIEHSWADFQFINRWLWHAKDILWKDQVIVLMGHEDEKNDNNWSFSQWRKEMFNNNLKKK